MGILYSSLSKLSFFGVVLALSAYLAFGADQKGADRKLDEVEFQNFIKGYKELAEKYPNASNALTIVDGKTRSELPLCSGAEMPCCKLFIWPHCDSWGCCPEIR
jgi:hypothetical protein